MSSFTSSHHHSNDRTNFAFHNFDVYSDTHNRVARVIDGLQNVNGELQYLLVEFTDWEPGKQLLIPVNLVQVDVPTQRLYVTSLNRQQVLNTPAYNRQPGGTSPIPATSQEHGRSTEYIVPLEASAPLEGYPVTQRAIPPIQIEEPISTPHLVQSADSLPHPPVSQVPPTQLPAEISPVESIPLREERLIVDRKKQKAGEVVVRKEIETEIVEVPIKREKLIVEQVGDEPKQLAEIDLTDDEHFPDTQHRGVDLPPIPKRKH